MTTDKVKRVEPFVTALYFTIKAWLNLTSFLIADIWNYESHVYLVYFLIVLNVRNKIESKYPAIVFSEYILKKEFAFKKVGR